MPHLSLLEGEEVSLWTQRGDKETISGDITGGLAPCQPEGTVGQRADLQVSGTNGPRFS